MVRVRKGIAVFVAVLCVALVWAWQAGWPGKMGSSPHSGYPLRFPLPALLPESPVPEPPPSDVLQTELDPALPVQTPVLTDRVADLPTPHAPPGKPQLSGGGDFALPIAFDLRSAGGGTASAADGEIAIRKAVVHNGTEIGSAALWVQPGGAIEIATAELAGLMAPVDGTLASELRESGQDRTSFRSLRNRGFAVNFDPIGDRIVIQRR
ncbi:hypothetical protein GRI40_02010 [Altererythrobacter aerius]|uniref:Uncharacterized protein n=1 Tax=Tsuneonella aeria TaxID=1837929 RepID=A0A6I4TBM0_9SPHN|nr:hypothetical protein [Tsuneonella aeria]MXO73996.1 hypothetical protein [Tsuneonella aeria]